MMLNFLLDLGWLEEAVPNRRGNQDTVPISAKAKAVSISPCFAASINLEPPVYVQYRNQEFLPR